MATTTPKPKAKTDLVKIVRRTTIDGVKIVAVSGALAFVGLSDACSVLPQQIGLPSGEISPLQRALLAFDVGSGAYAGFKEKYGASLAVYGATLIPDVYDVMMTGDIGEAGKRALAKTIVYGGSYAMGWLFK